MKIREIENIIDHEHEEHSVFKLSKKQATFNALATFEDGTVKKVPKTDKDLTC